MRVKLSAVRSGLCPDTFQRIPSHILEEVQISLPHHSTVLAAPLPKTRILQHSERSVYCALLTDTGNVSPYITAATYGFSKFCMQALYDYRLHTKSQCKLSSGLKTAKCDKHLVSTLVKRVKFQTVMSLKPANPQKLHSGTDCNDCCCCACTVSLAAINHLQGFCKASFFNQQLFYVCHTRTGLEVSDLKNHQIYKEEARCLKYTCILLGKHFRFLPGNNNVTCTTLRPPVALVYGFAVVSPRGNCSKNNSHVLTARLRSTTLKNDITAGAIIIYLLETNCLMEIPLYMIHQYQLTLQLPPLCILSVNSILGRCVAL